jgi:hypothetical protein
MKRGAGVALRGAGVALRGAGVVVTGCELRTGGYGMGQRAERVVPGNEQGVLRTKFSEVVRRKD